MRAFHVLLRGIVPQIPPIVAGVAVLCRDLGIVPTCGSSFALDQSVLGPEGAWVALVLGVAPPSAWPRRHLG